MSFKLAAVRVGGWFKAGWNIPGVPEALLLLFTVGWAFFYYGGPTIVGAQYDDSYITYRYALNLAAGNGLVFNPGDYADSASSFLYTLLLAAVAFLGAGGWLEVAGVVIGLLSTVFIAWRLFHIWQGWGVPTWASTLLGVGVMVNGFASAWAIEGMETPLFAALLLVAVEQVLLRNRGGWRAYALLMAVALTRPEGLLLTLVYGLHCMPWAALAHPRQWVTVSFWKDLLIRQKIGLAVLASMAVFYALKAWYYEGVWLSQAYWLKANTLYYAPLPAMIYAIWRKYLNIFFIIGGVMGFTLSAANRFRLLSWSFWLFTALFAVSVLMGMKEDFGRYGMPLVPLLALGLGQAVRSMLAWPRGHWAVVLLCVALVFQGLQSARWYRGNMAPGRSHQRCRVLVGDWLRTNTPPGMPLLGSDIGAIGYYAWPLPIIDMFGLTNRQVFNAVMAGQNKDAILQPLGQAWIADTWLPPYNRPAFMQLYPYYGSAANGFLKRPTHSRLGWRVQDAFLAVCPAGRVDKPILIGVRHIQFMPPRASSQ